MAGSIELPARATAPWRSERRLAAFRDGCEFNRSSFFALPSDIEKPFLHSRFQISVAARSFGDSEYSQAGASTGFALED